MGTAVPNGSVVAISLPPSLLRDSNDETQRIGFAVFADDTLFQPRDPSRNLEVGSLLVTATLHGRTVSDLTDGINITLQKTMPNASSVTCVFWDPDADGGYGDFSTDGCDLLQEDRTMVVCSCNHLTTFTILSDTTPTTEPPPAATTDSPDEVVFEGSEHNAVVYLLLTISLVLLILTIALHLGLRVLRDSNESRILINFCLSLLGLYFVTMLAYGEDMPEGACRLWAFLMVYFFLVALAWNFVEALLLLLSLKMSSFGDTSLTKKYFWIALPCSWGIPFVLALISLGGLEYYGENRLCQAYNWPFYTFLVVPLILHYIFHWAFYMYSLVKITQGTMLLKATRTSVHAFIYHIFAAMILSLLYGIGWAFGFLSSSDVELDAYITGQYFFSFLILIHAVLQFILYLPPRKVLYASIRELWHRTHGYDISHADVGQGGRSNEYASPERENVEGIKLEPSETHGDKSPLTDEGVSATKAASGSATTDDVDTVTSYTNKAAVESSDAEDIITRL